MDKLHDTDPYLAPGAGESQAARGASGNPKWMTWLGWVVSLLPALGLVPSAVFKFLQPPEMMKELDRMGWQASQMSAIGVVEIVCTILYLIPQTAVLGAILLTGYLGGAIATHVRISDGFMPPVIMGVLIWLGLFLRDPRVRALLPLRRR